MKSERKILFYKDYFISFYRALEVGAQKKTQKAPESEINMALKLKKEYYADKK